LTLDLPERTQRIQLVGSDAWSARKPLNAQNDAMMVVGMRCFPMSSLLGRDRSIIDALYIVRCSPSMIASPL